MKKIVIILSAIALLVIGAGVGYKIFFDSSKNDKDETLLMPLEKDIIVNMKDSRSIVKVNIALEIPKKSNQSELEMQEPKIRDAMIRILNSKTSADYSSDKIKDDIKNEFIQSVNSDLGLVDIKNIYFNDFVIQ